MEHIRIDPKFRRRPRPKRAGWVAREVFKFLLEVSAEFDLHGRFPKSMQDVGWLADEWANGDDVSIPTCASWLTDALVVLVEVGLLHQDGEELVITDWEEFYKPAKTGAQRQAESVARKRQAEAARVSADAGDGADKTDATIRNGTARHSTAQHDGVAPPSASILEDPTSPAPSEPKAVDPEPPRAGTVIIPTAPTSPPEEWLGTDFWRWAQERRHASGYLPERALNPRKLSAWWAEARAVVHEVKRLKEAYYRYAEDEFWGKADPPYPFSGFLSQWERFVPKREEEDAHAT